MFWRRRKERERDLERELRDHLELEVGERKGNGLSPEEAHYAARRAFGNATLIKEEVRETSGWTWVDSLLKDLHYAVRILVKSPLFAVTAVVTLAIGIGANTAIFSVANAVLLRSLPVRDPQRLFYLRVQPQQPEGAFNTGNGDSSFSEYVFERLRTQRQAFSDLIAYVPLGTNKIAARYGNASEEAAADMVSGNFFSGLGVRIICGRPFTMSDETSHATVAVLSYAYRKRHFAEGCGVLGHLMSVKGVPFTIIGVAAENFNGIENRPTDIWVPLQNRPELNAWGNNQKGFYADPNWWCLHLVGRLQAGITGSLAIAMLDAPFRHAAYEPLGGQPHRGERPRELSLVPARGIPGHRDEDEKPLTVLSAMVALVLVIACGNISILQAARNAARHREFSIRMAIGGSRARLFNQLFIESLLLVAAGTLLGWAFALAATRVLAVWADIQTTLAPDSNVLLFAIGVSVLVAFVFGLAPLFTTRHVPVALVLKSASSSVSQEKSKLRASQIIVALQVSICLVLVVAAGLLVRTLRNLGNVNLGFRPAGLLVFGINPQLRTSSNLETIRFFQSLLNRLQSLPGVEAVTLMGNRIGSGWSNNTTAVIDGKPADAAGANRNTSMRWNTVGPNYFTTLDVPILYGRDFTDSDSQDAPKVAIVNQTFAKRFLADREPLGHLVSFTSKTPYTIIGVVGNSKYTSVRERDVPMAYFPYTQVGIGTGHFEVRTVGEPASFWPVIRKAVGALAPDVALLQPMTQRAQFDSSISEERLVARLAMFFGVVAIMLVATGLYGILAYSVSRRIYEIGIRMALGAQRSSVLWMVMRDSLVMGSIGILVGLPLVFASERLLTSLLYGLAPNDPLTICMALVGIASVTVAASLIPARRAASVDPIRALKYE